MLWQCDEALVLVLRFAPSEIDRLEMDDYWRWVRVAERVARERAAALQA